MESGHFFFLTHDKACAEVGSKTLCGMKILLGIGRCVGAGILALGLVGLAGCLATPVERTGGPGSITIPNTNTVAVATAAREVFPRYGFSTGPSGLPNWISFQRPVGRTGQLAFGGFHGQTVIRARLTLLPIAGTNDIRVIPRVSNVRSAGVPGFEDETPMIFRSWATQLRPILREIHDRAANAAATPPR